MTALDRFRERLVDAQVDGAIVTSYPNRFWLSGHTATDGRLGVPHAVLLVPTDGEAVLLTGPNNVAWAEEEATGFRVEPLAAGWASAAIDRVVALGWDRVGIEPGALPYPAWSTLAGVLSAERLIDLDPILASLRATKDADEVAKIRAALAVTEQALASVLPRITAGDREHEVARRLDIAMLTHGADGPGFDTIVASGPNAARPHHRPGDREIREGEPIIIDLGARLGGYNGDLTRTTWLGTPDQTFTNNYNAVLDAQRAALAAILPGASTAEADRGAREALERAGLRDGIIHSVGHGLGIEVHEAPSASIRSADRFAIGNVVTVEPGIYLDGWGGIRIEDVVLVTDSGFDKLTTSPT